MFAKTGGLMLGFVFLATGHPIVATVFFTLSFVGLVNYMANRQ
jgi:hypothetical protein